VKDLIQYVYDIKDGQIADAPAWTTSERYDIDAKVDDSIAAEEQELPRDQRMQLIRVRVRALLADRFKLQVHHERRDLPVFVLVVAKGGPKFAEESAQPPSPASTAAHGPPPGSLTMRATAKQRPSATLSRLSPGNRKSAVVRSS
jgi:uncharacterized protein (TIGR03435 family)